ncbi:Copper transport protein ATOX1 [Hondaea fermentalgiana]|uniref:Copper transport protein ATOX1 n=1 Tax=Hondaea fermentalgiana TaxID=2315210 RepID=A0A2R5G3F9_9STRA|nr:Copper transport protein ATOX1 [Hondaea fermentalgiana]|eukprot:GBG25576.1 Copper transport protein ATOX1 [Hondaea fermentalgiana]
MTKMVGRETTATATTTLIPAGVEMMSIEDRLALFRKRVRPLGRWGRGALQEKTSREFDYALGPGKPEMKAKNSKPSSTEPCVYDDETALIEALQCAMFVNEKTADPGIRLVPDDDEDGAQLEETIDLWNGLCVPLLYRLLMNQDTKEDAKIVRDLCAALRRVDALFEAQSFEGPYFLGDRLSLADIIVAPLLDRFAATLPYYRGFDMFAPAPRLAKLYEAVKLRPAFADTMRGPNYYVRKYKSYAKVERIVPDEISANMQEHTILGLVLEGLLAIYGIPIVYDKWTRYSGTFQAVQACAVIAINNETSHRSAQFKEKMPETTFNVEMSCGGCSGACTRILKKIDGVEEVDASLEDQKITVQHDSSVTADTMLEALQKWAQSSGKKVSKA